MSISPIQDILADIRAGKQVILIDDEDRENEGDLILPPISFLPNTSTSWPSTAVA